MTSLWTQIIKSPVLYTMVYVKMSQNADPESYKIASEIQVQIFPVLAEAIHLLEQVCFPSVLKEDYVIVLHNLVDMFTGKLYWLTIGRPESK